MSKAKRPLFFFLASKNGRHAVVIDNSYEEALARLILLRSKEDWEGATMHLLDETVGHASRRVLASEPDVKEGNQEIYSFANKSGYTAVIVDWTLDKARQRLLTERPGGFWTDAKGSLIGQTRGSQSSRVVSAEQPGMPT
jgi:hypothetical protein